MVRPLFVLPALMLLSCMLSSGSHVPRRTARIVLCDDGDGAAGPAHQLHVLVWGPRAVQLSAFYIRSANTGTDCVVTSIGIAGGAVSERDLVRSACGAPSATSAAFWNRLLP